MWSQPMAMPAAPLPRQPVLAEMARGLPPAAATGLPPPGPPKVRMQAPEESPAPAARPISLPSPEELGIMPPAPQDSGAKNPASGTVFTHGVVDWNATRGRLQRLGVTSFRVDRAASGWYQVTFMLATEANLLSHHVQSTAETEAEAVSLALVETERWRQQAVGKR